MGTSMKSVNYDEIANLSNNIGMTADQMQTEIKKAFEEISNMKDAWYGKSYDDFVSIINESVGGLNYVFTRTVSDIPGEIFSKAKSMADANDAQVTINENRFYQITLSEFETTNKGSEFRFISDEVSGYQVKIKQFFTAAKEYVEQAKKYANQLKPVWESTAGDKNVEVLLIAFNQIQKTLDSFAEALDKNVAARIRTMESKERAAQNVQAAADIALDDIKNADNAARQKAAETELNSNEDWTRMVNASNN